MTCQLVSSAYIMTLFYNVIEKIASFDIIRLSCDQGMVC